MLQAELIEKQQDYIERIQQGECDLIPGLWELMRPLTEKLINRYVFKSKGTRLYERDDLLSLSYIALCNALKGYNSEKGAFSTYYFMYIQNTTAELRGVRKAHDVNRDAVSLNRLLKDSEDDELMCMFEDSKASQAFVDIERRIFLEQLRTAFAKLDKYLTDRERYVIHAHYFEGKSMTDISMEMGITRERVGQIEFKAMQKYRVPRSDVDLTQFWDCNKYYHTGVQSFKHSGMSSVERCVEYRSNLYPYPVKIYDENV